MQTVNEYGILPYKTAVLHGGPGAAGSMAPVAKQLSKTIGIIEPLQTADSVEGQITELFEQLSAYTPPLVLAGHSWGAILGLLFAAQYPEMVERLVLIGCPPLDNRYVPEITKNRINNLNGPEAEEAKDLLSRAGRGCLSNAALESMGELMEKADAYENDPDRLVPKITPDAHIFRFVWMEAQELRRSGGLRERIKGVRCDVTVLHGRQDPHPYQGVVEVLDEAGVKHDLILLEQCGHTPWEERYAAEPFFEQLSAVIKSGAL